MFCFVLAFLTQSCENQTDIDLPTPEKIDLVETRNDDHPVRPPGSTSTAPIPEECVGFELDEGCDDEYLVAYKKCQRIAKVDFITDWFESGCDAWTIDVTPYLTNQMVHIAVEMGGEDVITTIPHPSIPDFTSLYYNISLEGCDTAVDDMLNSFNDDCFECKFEHDNCCY